MKSGKLLLWGLWDTVYQRCTRLKYVDKGRNIFRIVKVPYRGETLVTSDNQQICSGDLILRLHIHNYLFACECNGIADETRVVLRLRRLIVSSLPQLALYLATLPQSQQIKGVVGTTMLNKGVEQIGFTVSDVPMTWFFRYKRWYLKYLLLAIHPNGRERIKNYNKRTTLKRVYMSKEELFRRYLPSS
ncbi:MAG: YkoP family protein [Clostridia bacterium]